jgi:YbbR domain-containing protein
MKKLFDDYIAHNFGWKLISLLVAGLTWITINKAFHRDETRVENLKDAPVIGTFTRKFPEVPVTVLMSATNTNRYVVTPMAVAVDLSGDNETDLKNLPLSKVVATVDLTGAGDEKEFRRRIIVLAPAANIRVSGYGPAMAGVERVGR